jgi:hypothetical protein
MNNEDDTTFATGAPKDVQRMARLLQLERVHLRRSQCERWLPDDHVIRQLNFDLRRAVGTTEGRRVEFIIGVNLKYLGAQDESVAVIDCEFSLDYAKVSHVNTDRYSAATLEAFAFWFGAPAVWPYAVELFQNMAWRLSLPSTTLPIFRHDLFPDLLRIIETV